MRWAVFCYVILTRTRKRTLATLGIAFCCVSSYLVGFALDEVELDARFSLRPSLPMLPLAESSLTFSLDCGGKGGGSSSIQVCDLDKSSGGAGVEINFARLSLVLCGVSCIRRDGDACEACPPLLDVLGGKNRSKVSSVDRACL